MLKITKLKTISMCDKNGNCYEKYYPSDYEYIEKINEIIDVVNKLLEMKDVKNS